MAIEHWTLTACRKSLAPCTQNRNRPENKDRKQNTHTNCRVDNSINWIRFNSSCALECERANGQEKKRAQYSRTIWNGFVFLFRRRRRRPVSNVNHNNLHNILLRSCNVCLAFVWRFTLDVITFCCWKIQIDCGLVSVPFYLSMLLCWACDSQISDMNTSERACASAFTCFRRSE